MQRKLPTNGASVRVNPAIRRSTPWHAVSVLAGPLCCEAARALPTIRYLSREAPRLPLAHCSSPASCSCSYKHYADRRGQPRRKDDLSGLRRAPISGSIERRVLRGRREDDL
jgi:hypothetical protein